MKIRLITHPINKIKQVILEFIHNNHIINWTPLQKSALMLTLACAMNFSWILWKGYILITPSVWQWSNLGEFKHEVRQFQKPYDNQQAEQISLMV